MKRKDFAAVEQKLGSWEQRRLQETSGKQLKAAEPTILDALQRCIDKLLKYTKEPVRILDAGCGKRLPVPLAHERYVVGLDLSVNQVDNNSEIDERIVGDLETYQFEASSFDVVICWNVLEHLNDPRVVLHNFERALKRPGVLVIAVPHARSLKGLITKYTPFWFHKFIWRRLLSATPSFEPFPTVMSTDVLPGNLKGFARDNNLSIEFLEIYENWQQKSIRSRVGVRGRTFSAIKSIVTLMSFGFVTAGATDVIIVMTK